MSVTRMSRINQTERAAQARKDAAIAVRFMAVTAAVFILLPLVVAVVMVWRKWG